jgi:hypothetical protein
MPCTPSGFGTLYCHLRPRAIVPVLVSLFRLAIEGLAAPIGMPPSSGTRTVNDNSSATALCSVESTVSWDIAAVPDAFLDSYLLETDSLGNSHFPLQPGQTRLCSAGA